MSRAAAPISAGVVIMAVAMVGGLWLVIIAAAAPLLGAFTVITVMTRQANRRPGVVDNR